MSESVYFYDSPRTFLHRKWAPLLGKIGEGLPLEQEEEDAATLREHSIRLAGHLYTYIGQVATNPGKANIHKEHAHKQLLILSYLDILPPEVCIRDDSATTSQPSIQTHDQPEASEPVLPNIYHDSLLSIASFVANAWMKTIGMRPYIIKANGSREDKPVAFNSQAFTEENILAAVDHTSFYLAVGSPISTLR